MKIRIHTVETAERFHHLSIEYGRALNARNANPQEHVPPTIIATDGPAAQFLADLLGIDVVDPAVPLKTVVIDASDYEEFEDDPDDAGGPEDDEENDEGGSDEGRREELEAMNVDDLKELLRSLDEPVSGNKDELIERVLEAESD